MDAHSVNSMRQNSKYKQIDEKQKDGKYDRHKGGKMKSGNAAPFEKDKSKRLQKQPFHEKIKGICISLLIPIIYFDCLEQDGKGES